MRKLRLVSIPPKNSTYEGKSLEYNMPEGLLYVIRGDNHEQALKLAEAVQSVGNDKTVCVILPVGCSLEVYDITEDNEILPDLSNPAGGCMADTKRIKGQRLANKSKTK